jgi:hypothetical protein
MNASYADLRSLPFAKALASLVGKTRLCMTIEDVPSEENPRTDKITSL